MRMLLLSGLAVAASTSARAQAINIDVHDAFGTPASTFGAGALQTGVWNAVPPTVGITPLVDVAGAVSGVTISAAGMAAAYSNDNAGTSGDDEALMDDLSNPSPNGATWTIAGLQPGNYVLYTYGWAPDNPLFVSSISVAGSIDGTQTVGGTWTGVYQLGLTHARHRVSVAAGGTIAMSITAAGGGSFGSLNGFQVVPDGSTFFKSCFPGTGGVIGCPCGQPANPSGGCANFGANSTTGAVLNASGIASVSADSLVLTTSNHRTPLPPAGILNVFFSYKPGSSTPTTGIPSGAGVRCIGTGGSLKRLYSAQCVGGTLSKPAMGDPSVSARSASFAGHAIAPPETRFYFNVYRDGQASGPCGTTAVSSNLTNMGSILWGP